MAFKQKCGRTWTPYNCQDDSAFFYAPDMASDLLTLPGTAANTWDNTCLISAAEYEVFIDGLKHPIKLQFIFIARCEEHKLSPDNLCELFLVEISHNEAVARYVMSQ